MAKAINGATGRQSSQVQAAHFLWVSRSESNLDRPLCLCDNFQLLVAPVQRKFIVKQWRKMLLDAAHDLAPFTQEMPSDLFFVLGALVLVQCNYDSDQTHTHFLQYNTCSGHCSRSSCTCSFFVAKCKVFLKLDFLYLCSRSCQVKYN
jgi:hypothetical protein